MTSVQNIDSDVTLEIRWIKIWIGKANECADFPIYMQIFDCTVYSEPGLKDAAAFSSYIFMGRFCREARSLK